MSAPLLDTTTAPEDPIERLLWLSGVNAQVRRELEVLYADAYFDARLTGRLDAACNLRQHSRRRILAFTRAANQRRGRAVRWQDGADPTSTAYAR